MVTADIVDALRRDRIDAALVAGGTCGEGIQEHELFDDRFHLYVSRENPLFERTNVRIEDIDLKELVLLSPGHCMRDQRRLHAWRDDYPRNGRGIHSCGASLSGQNAGQGGYFAQDRRGRAPDLCQKFDHQSLDRYYFVESFPPIGIRDGYLQSKFSDILLYLCGKGDAFGIKKQTGLFCSALIFATFAKLY